MIKNELKIEGIPAVLWGQTSDRLFVAVHGNMSDKADTVIAIFAEEAVSRGYQVLSFDLPEHGDRKNEPYACSVQNCVHDLDIIMRFAANQSKNISLFACSMGAYFSLLSCTDIRLAQCLFLSPILNMERVIHNMMACFGVSEERLESEKEIPTPIGQTLYWDYYNYVKTHPIESWDKPTAILYGSRDDMSEFGIITDFCNKFSCNLTVLENGEHYFHSTEQLIFFREWLHKHIYVNYVQN